MLSHDQTAFCALHFFFYSFTASDASEGTTAGCVASPRTIMVCHGFRSNETRRARKQKINYPKQQHTPQCWLPAKVMHPANSTKRFSRLTHSSPIFIVKNVQIYIHIYVLTVILFFSPRLTLKPLLSKVSLRFLSLFLSPSLISLIKVISSAYTNSLNTPLVSLVTTSTTTAWRIGNDTDPWCILTLASNSTKNPLWLFFALSSWLISNLTETLVIPFWQSCQFMLFYLRLRMYFIFRHFSSFLFVAFLLSI